MTPTELRQAAIDCLGKAFKGDAASRRIPMHVIQAAVVIITTPTTTEKK
jgi:hypothetical protein